MKSTPIHAAVARILLSCILLLAAGCGKPTPAEQEATPRQVVLLFRDAPPQSGTDRLGGSLMCFPEGSVTYVDTLLRRVYYIPRTIGYDTLVVPAPYGYAEVHLRNQAIDEIPYLLLAGDTVLFTYDANHRPRLRSLTSDGNTRLYHLLWHDPRAVQPNGYSTRTVLTDFYFILSDKVMKNKVKCPDLETRKKYRSYYIDLDSLRTIYEAYRCAMHTTIDSLVNAGEIPAAYATYYRQQLAEDPTFSSGLEQCDSLLHYISNWRQALIQLSGKHPCRRSTERFDRFASDTTILPKFLLALLREQMASIERGEGWRPYPEETVARYRARYRDLTGDSTSFVSLTIDKENLLPEGYVNDLILEALDGGQVALETILHKHRGKVIYVDLWASWCAPCRGAMPAAKVLREQYKGRDVVFLYLAVNDARERWRSAVRSCRTDYLGENYRILNADTSHFLQQIKHTKIPHMLLYDRSGKLVDMDAPRPESEEIRRMIDRCLSIGH